MGWTVQGRIPYTIKKIMVLHRQSRQVGISIRNGGFYLSIVIQGQLSAGQNRREHLFYTLKKKPKENRKTRPKLKSSNSTKNENFEKNHAGSFHYHH